MHADPGGVSAVLSLPGSILARIRTRLYTWAGRIRREYVHLEVDGMREDRGFGVVGSPHVRHHFSRIYLGVRARHVVRTGFHFRGCAGFVRGTAGKRGLCVVSEVRIPPDLRGELLRVPRFVSLSLPVTASPEIMLDHMSASARSDVRRMRNRGFSCRITRDLRWVDEFHRRYLLPSMTRRHGREGYTVSMREIANQLRYSGAEFLQVMHGGVCVAAALFVPGPAAYHAKRVGWLDGEYRLVKEGSFAALYWFALERACRLGFSSVHLGGTPPYLEDGVFRFKAKWGARLDRAETRFGDVYLALDPSHADCRRLLMERSILAYGTGESFVVFSGRTRAEVPVAPGILAGIGAWYRLRDEPDETRVVDYAGVPEKLGRWFVREFPPDASASG